MLFNKYVKREKYDYLKLRIEILKNKLLENQLKTEYIDYFLNIISNENQALLDIYVNNQMYFGIFLEYKHSEIFSDNIYLHTRSPSSLNSICLSDADLCKNNITINNIYTSELFARQGHASRQLSAYCKIAQNLGKAKICGMLWAATPIGLDNLKNFYIKNKFKINEYDFSKEITVKNA